MSDKRFARSVIYLCAHSAEGAMGLIINQRAPHISFPELLGQLSIGTSNDDDSMQSELIDMQVHVGGPVQPQAVIALGEFEDPHDASRLVVGDLGVVDPDNPEAELRRARIYAGYAGWAPDQLEAELEEEAWIVEPVDPDDPFHDDDLWAVALQRKGGEYALLARMPVDPSLN
jgi:putative transcriptional regulator